MGPPIREGKHAHPLQLLKLPAPLQRTFVGGKSGGSPLGDGHLLLSNCQRPFQADLVLLEGNRALRHLLRSLMGDRWGREQQPC